MFSRKHILLAVILAGLTVSEIFAQIQVFAQIGTSSDIYVGEPFIYYIIIDGDNKPGQVDITPLEPFNPRSAGNQDRSQTSISIINGKTTKQQINRFLMGYTLRSNSAGAFTIPPVDVIVEGQKYKTNPVQVNILKPGTTDQLYLELNLSERKCYVGQPVILTVKFYRYAEIGDYSLRVPVLERDDFILEDLESIDRQAGLYQLGNGVPIYVTENRVTHNNREAILLQFSKVLIPKVPGQFTIEPAKISADVAVGIARSNDPFDSFFGRRSYNYKRFIVDSQPLSLEVLPLPEQDKPREFYGLVGRYTISASAQPVAVGVGDPITLTIKISGSKYLKSVRWPELERITELESNFRIPAERASPVVEDGFKIFTQTIRANNDKVTQIPPIPLAYFDVEQGRYVVVQSNPIKLDVSPTRILTALDLKGDSAEPFVSRVEVIRKGLSANYEGPEVLINQEFSLLLAVFSQHYMLLWTGPLAFLVISAFIRVMTYSTPQKIAYRTKRRAAATALKSLEKTKHCRPDSRHEQVVMIMKKYIADKFEKAAGSLTCDECFEILKNAGVAEQKASQYRDILNNIEAAKFSPVDTEVNDRHLKEIAELIKDVNKMTRK